MKAQRYRLLNVPAVGFLVLVVTLLVLFWARWGLETARRELLPAQTWKLDLDASGLIMPKTAQEPNGVRGILHAEMTSEAIDSESLGLTQYQRSLKNDTLERPVYVWGGRGNDSVRLYYDRSAGMIVWENATAVRQPNETYAMKTVVSYAGPEGISDKPDRKLGRFGDPVVRLIAGNLDRPIVYDRGLRRFFAIEWRGRSVRQGPKLPDKTAAPVDFGWPRKQARCLSLHLETSEPHYTHGIDPTQPLAVNVESRAVVLDTVGSLRMLNLDTLDFYPRPVGRLPAPDTLFPPVGHVRPDDLSAYNVLPVFLGRGDIYAGCAVAALSRDATSMKVEVFDANGTSAAMQLSTFKDPFMIAKSVGRRVSPSTVSALYFELPGAAALTAAKYILECLHPPVLLWLSYFATSDAEAIAGHQSLFVLPDSFVAMKAREVDSAAISRFTTSLLFLLPGVLLGVLLGVSVGRDARRMGVEKRARWLWMAATVLFAVPAYVTYRLTRPTAARVTCQNCGRDRWVDWEKCHHCGSPWLVPELIPPAWRVIGQMEEQADNEPSPRPEEKSSRTFDV